MNCSDIQHAIYVFLDGELDDADSATFAAHLGHCPECAAVVDAESNFLQKLRGALPQETAPEGLKLRITEALAAAPIPQSPEQPTVHQPSRAARWRPWIAVAAAALLSVVAWRIAASPEGQTATAGTVDQRLVSESVASHHRHLPMEVRGSEANVKEFLGANLPFAAELPFANERTVQLVGARLTRVAGRDAVLYNLVVDGERVTVTQVVADTRDIGSKPGAPVASTHDGYDVMTWRRRGLTHTLVGQGDNTEVRRIVRASYRPD